MKPTKEQIEAVAEWWAVRTFDKAFNQNNGDDSQNGAFTFALMNMLSVDSRSAAPVDARDRFKESIITQIASIEPEHIYSFDLSVDYHPSEMLSVACQFAGINTSMVPIKSSTWWDHTKNKFVGKYQYGGRPEEI